MQLDERPRVRVLARFDRFDRFVSVLVFVPRERYDSAIRARIGDYLARAFLGGVGLLSVLPGRAAGARTFHHRPLRRTGAASYARHSRARGARHRAHLADGLNEALMLAHDPAAAHELFNRYRDAFSLGLQDYYSPASRRERHSRDRSTRRRPSARRRFSATATAKNAVRSA